MVARPSAWLPTGEPVPARRWALLVVANHRRARHMGAAGFAEASAPVAGGTERTDSAPALHSMHAGARHSGYRRCLASVRAAGYRRPRPRATGKDCVAAAYSRYPEVRR